MANVELSHIDLECGGHRRSSAVSDEGSSEDGSICFSDADEGSCYSQFYSTHDGSNDDYSFACASDPEIGGVLDSRRVSSAAESDCSVDIENGVREIKLHLGKVERDCRICHLSLEGPNPESGIAIELGCSCKDDLAAAHKQCAEAWFKIKGNKTCEICNSVARNVFGTSEIESTQQTNETNVTPVNTVSAPVPPVAETQSCFNGHRFLNFLLACMVFAFVISWLFHFNIPS
ncbi:hypothetical protein F0562_016253 [Nyssa sinensis]|uniref:RING-CH-type domain-containing protein n=1 Tax=Nyssa sinensis TaxID=561372 RepID=A0A5J4ZJN4_9ASTE|nr:hypothetical protein F0562_016253 [Nyssa sinensis]